MPKVFVLYYSTYGHVQTLSRHIKKGLESQGVEVETYQVTHLIDNEKMIIAMIINQKMTCCSHTYTFVGARDIA